MTTLPERLQDVIEEMRGVAPTCENDWRDMLNEWAARIEAATALHPDALQDGRLSKSTHKRIAALEGAAQDDGWQPIDSAPRDGTRILALLRWTYSNGMEGETQDVIYWYGGGLFWVAPTPMNYVQGFDDGVEPTHWRPLPAAPIAAAPAPGDPK